MTTAPPRCRRLLLSGLLASVLLLPFGLTAQADDKPPRNVLPKGVYLDLSETFYRALETSATGGEKVYGTDMADEYLRQIAVSTRFMVETNLQLLRQQERIIQLLETRREDGGKP